MKSSAEKFWYGWLKIAAMLCTLFGVFAAVFNRTPAFDFINDLILKTFYPGVALSQDIAHLQAWLIGVLGASMAGWGVAMLYLIYYPLQRKETWAWRAIMVPLIVWFVIDSSLSVYYGAYFNLVINFILIMQFIAPLVFLKNSFTKQLEFTQ